MLYKQSYTNFKLDRVLTVCNAKSATNDYSIQ